MSPGARILRFGVLTYRRAVSPLLGPRCRFEPTCSSYALEALRVHGAVRGSALTVWRLLRCQPFGTPGYDPVPPLRARTPHTWHRHIKTTRAKTTPIQTTPTQTTHARTGLAEPDHHVRPQTAQVSDFSGNRPTQGVRAC